MVASTQMPQFTDAIGTASLETTVREELTAVDAHIQQVQNIVQDAVTKLGDGFQQLSKGSLEQQTLLESTLSSVVSGSADSITVAGFIERSQTLMRCALEGMQCANMRAIQLAEQLQSTTHVLGKLQNMTDEMSNISQQIRILALNASIEATRAGEAGRGFAVVAGAVKELSGHFRGISDRMETGIDSVRCEIQGISSQATTAAQQDTGFVEHTKVDASTLVKDASALNHTLADKLTTAHGIGTSVQQGLSLGLVGLQFGDLVTQIGVIASERVRALLPVVENAARIASGSNCSDVDMRRAAAQFIVLRSSIRPSSVQQSSLDAGEVELF